MAVTLGIISVAQALLDKAIEAIVKLFGATEEQAKDIVANGWLQAAEQIGIGALAIKSKTPSVIAEKLGFTSKGFNIRSTILAPKALEGAEVIAKAITTADREIAIQGAAQGVAAKGLTTFQKANEVLGFVAKLVGLPVGTLFMAAQFIDYGNWNSGAYQQTFQKILAIFGLEPDKTYVKSKVLSEDMSKRIIGIFQEKNATGIRDPRTGQTLPFTRENFFSVVDFMAAQIIYEKGSVSTKEVLGAVTSLVILSNKTATAPVSPAAVVPAPSGGASNVKVFTGIVSQGVLGAGLSFIARPDDIIESVYELQDAAQNNLAAYLAALPSKVIYEIKIVSSITTKDGFTQRGATQQVQSGTDTQGKPKYKTLVNKFAVLNLYILTDKSSRSKLASIVLGPTDAVKFTPSQDTLAQLEQSIQKSVFTSNVNDISTIQSEKPIATQSPSGSPADTGFILPAGFVSPPGEPIFTGGVSIPGKGLTQHFIWDGKEYSFDIPNDAFPPGPIPQDYMKQRALDTVKQAQQVAVISPGIEGANATTLFEWFSAKGQALPAIATRATLYERAGLGIASLYTGTAEQNTKLLNALKTGLI